MVVLVMLETERCSYDSNHWGDRTLSTAHRHLEESWNTIKDGDVVDVEYILGEKPAPSLSEMVDSATYAALALTTRSGRPIQQGNEWPMPLPPLHPLRFEYDDPDSENERREELKAEREELPTDEDLRSHPNQGEPK